MYILERCIHVVYILCTLNIYIIIMTSSLIMIAYSYTSSILHITLVSHCTHYS